MSNATDRLSPTSRAMLVSAILGGTASAASHMSAYRNEEISTNELVADVVADSLKAGLAGGAATYVAGKMAGQPVLSMLTILSVGAAGIYLMDQNMRQNDNE